MVYCEKNAKKKVHDDIAVDKQTIAGIWVQMSSLFLILSLTTLDPADHIQYNV